MQLDNQDMIDRYETFFEWGAKASAQCKQNLLLE